MEEEIETLELNQSVYYINNRSIIGFKVIGKRIYTDSVIYELRSEKKIVSLDYIDILIDGLTMQFKSFVNIYDDKFKGKYYSSLNKAFINYYSSELNIAKETVKRQKENLKEAKYFYKKVKEKLNELTNNSNYLEDKNVTNM